MAITLPTIRKSGARLLLSAGVALTLAVPGAGPALATAQRAGARPLPVVVSTDKGAVRGMYAGDAREFLGIPYAAPPVGALRWQPPQPASRWAGVRAATAPGANCAQTGSLASGVITTSTAEDCPYLNVYTPRTAPHRPLPVMVFSTCPRSGRETAITGCWTSRPHCAGCSATPGPSAGIPAT